MMLMLRVALILILVAGCGGERKRRPRKVEADGTATVTSTTEGPVITSSQVTSSAPPQPRSAPGSEYLTVAGGVQPPQIETRIDPRMVGDVNCHERMIFEVKITKEGRVTSVLDINTYPDQFTSTYATFINQWTFKPATYHGGPVAVKHILDVSVNCAVLYPPTTDTSAVLATQ